MAKAPGLTRKGAAYYYRKRLPEDVRVVLGQRELWVALGTKDYRKACEAARRAAVAADERIARARSGTLLETREEKAALSDAALQQVAKSHLYRLERDAVGFRDEVDQAELERELAALLSGGEHAPHLLSAALRLADEFGLETRGMPTPSSGAVPLQLRSEGEVVAPSSVLRLIDLVRRAKLEHLHRRLDRLNGYGGDAVHDPLFSGVSTISAAPKISSVVTLGEALKRFSNDPTRAHLGDTADAKYVRTFQAMRQLIGEQRPLVDITRGDCAAVLELIARLPANFAKLKSYKNCNGLQEVAELADERVKKFGDRLMSPGTVAVYTFAQSAFFNWCIRKGLLSVNPARMMAPPRTGSRTTKRPFTVAELNKIVAGLQDWSGGGRLQGRKWVPLIALFSGMRLGEIVTLVVDDVQVKDEALCLVLRRTEEKSLKTGGAERVVPVHPELVRLGFFQDVEVMRQAGGKRLFPDLPGDGQKQIADLFQKRFSYFQKRKLGIAEKGVSFHCFRHGFRDALREAGIPSDVTKALGGWSRSGGVEERYGQGTRVATLARWMAQVSYPGLDLSPFAGR